MLLAGWIALALAAAVYSRIAKIPVEFAIPLAAAFLIELPFYLSPGLWPRSFRRPLELVAASLLPYLIYSLPTGEFHIDMFAGLAAIACVPAFWYTVFPARPLSDFAFIGFAALIYLSKVLDQIYSSPVEKLQISVLGHIMLIRTCALAILAIRPAPAGVEFRFLPTLREIRVGLIWFAGLVPTCALALYAVKLNATSHAARNVWLLAPQFFGILWIVALSEEFAFRGLLQQWLEKANPFFGLLAASVLFGAAHLGFAHIFPNWRFAIVAAVFGLFCGLAWRQTRSIQSAMITHALGATIYRVFIQ